MPNNSVSAGSAPPPPEEGLSFVERYINVLSPLSLIALVCIAMLFLEPRFFRPTNMRILFLDASLYMIMGVGMTLVITGAGIDLSIGSIAALSAVLMAGLIKDFGLSWSAAIPLGLLIGAACGLMNGVVITKLNIPDLICTLSTDLVFRGLALVYAAGAVLHRFPPAITWLGAGRVIGIPVPVIIGFIAIAIGHFVYHNTYLGRYAVAIGGNREGAILSGINVPRNKIYHYIVMGTLAAAAGVLLTGRLNAIMATSADGFALHTIAAVVVGGTSLFGGRGSMLGTLIGAVLLSMVVNALIILRLPFFWQQVASGIIIITSMAFYGYIQRRGKD